MRTLLNAIRKWLKAVNQMDHAARRERDWYPELW